MTHSVQSKHNAIYYCFRPNNILVLLLGKPCMMNYRRSQLLFMSPSKKLWSHDERSVKPTVSSVEFNHKILFSKLLN